MNEQNQHEKIIKILFLEDDPIDRKTIKKRFEKFSKYEINIVETVEQAMQSLDRHNYDLIVTDYYLNDGTGLNLIEKVKHIPIIFITGSDDVNSAITAMKAGARDYLIKDISSQYLNLLPIAIDRVIKELDNERALLKVEKEKEKAIHEKEKYLSILSHEIRNPVNALIGLLGSLKNVPQKKQLKIIENLEYIGDGLLNLISDILDLSKAQKSDYHPVKVPFSLKKLIKHVVEIYQAKALSEKINFRVFVDPKVPGKLIGDEVRVKQIITNLIDNALKFTSNGEVKLEIMKNVSKKKDLMVRFIVSDTGIGMRENELKNIFKPFIQLLNHDQGGTGLGLSIVDNLVKSLKGKIQVVSTPGSGSTFTVDLPFNLPSGKMRVKKTASNFRVLCVEDMKSNQFLMKELFKQWKIKIDIASNGVEALEYCKSHQYQLVLMDIGLPGSSGLSVSQKIRKLKNYSPGKATIIALSGKESDDLMSGHHKSGIDDFIQKPFVPKVLHQKITSLLNP